LVCSTSNTVLLAPVDKKKNKKEYDFTSQATILIRKKEKKANACNTKQNTIGENEKETKEAIGHALQIKT